jgi:transposase
MKSKVREGKLITIEFSPADIDTLEYERYHYPHPKVQKKMEALYLKSQNVPHGEICRLCRISKTTLTTYLGEYQTGGVARLKELDYQGQPSELNQHRASLTAYFKEHPPRNTAEAQAAIEQLTGLKRSPTQVRALMKRLGLKCRKVGFVPGRATDPDKQAEQENFRVNQLEPRLQEAEAGQRVVLFMDAAHFVYGVFLGMVWCFVRLFMPSPSGRKRFNVLGAINAVTKEVLIVTNETYINAESVCLLLTDMAHRYGSLPITLVLDNARYQKCELVFTHAAALGIELLFLPSYSPHLNLIERLWRFVRKECLYSKSYADFASFKQAIATCIETAHTEHRAELDTLLAWNFQSFKKVQFLPV